MLSRCYGLVLFCALAACDLPTDPATARARFDDARSIRLAIPVPEMRVSIGEQLTRADVGLGGMLDTTTFTLRLPTLATHVALDRRIPTQGMPNGGGPRFIVEHEEVFKGLDAAATTDVLRDVQWSDVELQVTIRNKSRAGLIIDTLSIIAGNTRVRVPAVTLAAGRNTTVTLPGSDLTNALLRRVALGHQPRVIVRAIAALNGGSVAAGDVVGIEIALEAPLRFRMPAAGIAVARIVHLGIDSTTAGVTQAIKSGRIDLSVSNNIPLASAVTVILAPTPRDTTGFDPAASASAIRLAPIVLSAASVTSHTIEIPVDQLHLLVSGRVSVALLVKLSGGTAPVTLTRADEVVINANLHVELSASREQGK